MAEITQIQDTRRIFIQTLSGLAQKDPTVCLVVCDVGFNYTEEFKEKFPKQYFNLGTTEMSSMAEVAGMALEGMKPYIYSMINFMVFRPYEALRNCVCCHNANVKILGVKGSEAYKFLGFSHNLLHDREDESILSNLPNMKIHLPQSPEGVREVILQEYKREGPAYIRL